MRPSPRILVAPIVSLLLILLLNTCGIESYVQLNAPIDGEASGEIFSFWKSYYNSETEFRGFDLYYRMYLKNDTPDYNSIVEFEDLAANGFLRIHAWDDVKDQPPQRPLIPIQLNDCTPPPTMPPPVPPWPDNDQFPLFVDFTGEPPLLLLDPPYPRIVDDGLAPPDDYGLIDSPADGELSDPPPILFNITDIRRDVNYTTDTRKYEFKQFSDFSAIDVGKDLTAEVWDDIEFGLPVQLVLYAVSYGYVFSQNRSLHSKPLRLDSIERVFPVGDP